MKKLWICLAILISSQLTLHSQSVKPTINLGPSFKVKNDKQFIKHLHSDATGHYLHFEKISTTKIGFLKTTITQYLEKYDTDFNLIFSKEFVTEDKDKTIGLNLKSFGGKMYYLSTKRKGSKDKIAYTLTPINNDGELGTPKEFSIPKQAGKSYIQQTHWVTSPDSSKIMLAKTSGTQNKKNNFVAYFWVFDQSLNVVWKKGITLPITERKLETSDFNISNEGEIFFLGNIFDKNSKTKIEFFGKRREEPHQVEMFKLTETSPVERVVIAEKQDHINTGGLTVDSDNHPIFLGLYGTSENGPNRGAYYRKYYSSNNELGAPVKRTFTDKELLSFGKDITAKDKKSKKRGLEKGYHLNGIVHQANGEISVMIEENYFTQTTTTTTTSMGNPVSNRVSKSSFSRTNGLYSSNHIIVLNFSNEGTVQNINLIPKKQNYYTSTALSYKPFLLKDQIYYLYYDNKDNLSKKITNPDKYKKTTTTKKMTLLLTSISEKGKLKKTRIGIESVRDGMVMPEYISLIEKDTHLFITAKPVKKNSIEYRLGTITFK